MRVPRIAQMPRTMRSTEVNRKPAIVSRQRPGNARDSAKVVTDATAAAATRAFGPGSTKSWRTPPVTSAAATRSTIFTCSVILDVDGAFSRSRGLVPRLDALCVGDWRAPMAAADGFSLTLTSMPALRARVVPRAARRGNAS
jgi:hypothetical protein